MSVSHCKSELKCPAFGLDRVYGSGKFVHHRQGDGIGQVPAEYSKQLFDFGDCLRAGSVLPGPGTGPFDHPMGVA